MNNSNLNRSQSFSEGTNIENIHARICMLVDDELPPVDKKILLAEINANPEYKRLYEQERKFKTFIKNHAPKKKAPASLINSLKKQIGQIKE